MAGCHAKETLAHGPQAMGRGVNKRKPINLSSESYLRKMVLAKIPAVIQMTAAEVPARAEHGGWRRGGLAGKLLRK